MKVELLLRVMIEWRVRIYSTRIVIDIYRNQKQDQRRMVASRTVPNPIEVTANT